MKNQITATRSLIWVVVAGSILGFVVSWSLGVIHPFGFEVHMRPTGIAYGTAGTWPVAFRWLGALIGLPSVLMLVWGLLRLDAMLRRFSSAGLFALENIADLRAFAGATLLSTVLAIAESPLRALIFRLTDGGPVLKLSVVVDGDSVTLILVCLVFFLVTHLMHAARALAQENEEFV